MLTRAEAQNQFLEAHSKTLDSIKAKKSQFVIKAKYPSKVLSGEECISLFPRELDRTEDTYIQLTDFDYNSVDDQLYVYKHNPHWEEEYTQNQWIEKYQVHTYNIPINLLQPVDEKPTTSKKSAIKEPEQKTFEFAADFIDTDEDAMMTHMTMRDFTAIMTKTPVSKKTWLNNLIKQINR